MKSVHWRGSFLAVLCLFGHLRTYFGGLAVVHILRRCKEVYCKTNLEIVGSDWMTCYQGDSSQTLAKPITGPRPQSSPSAFLGQLLSHCYTTTIVAPILKWTKAFSSANTVTTHRRHNWAGRKLFPKFWWWIYVKFNWKSCFPLKRKICFDSCSLGWIHPPMEYLG